jgi:hypothetical protein
MTFRSAVIAVLTSTSLAMPTSAQGACKTIFRGELVPAPVPGRAIPRKFLFFSLGELVQTGGTRSTTSFQFFVIPNAITTLPIPFALDMDSSKDCPSELELNVFTADTNPPLLLLIVITRCSASRSSTLMRLKAYLFGDRITEPDLTSSGGWPLAFIGSGKTARLLAIKDSPLRSLGKKFSR